MGAHYWHWYAACDCHVWGDAAGSHLDGVPGEYDIIILRGGDNGVFGDNPEPAAVLFGVVVCVYRPIVGVEKLRVWGAAGWRGGRWPGTHGSGFGGETPGERDH